MKFSTKGETKISEINQSINDYFVVNGYSTKRKDSEVSFIRRSHKGFDRMMPIKELFNGFGEGKIKIQKHNDIIEIKSSFAWFLHVFTSILLLSALTFILFVINELSFNYVQLFVSFSIVLPISIIGYLKAKYQVNRIIKAAINDIV